MKRAPERLQTDQFFLSSSAMNVQERTTVLGTYACHWHEFYELTYFFSGNGRNRINGIEHPIRPGSLFLLSPTDFHEIIADDEETLVHTNIQFQRDALRDDVYELVYSTSHPLLAYMEADDRWRLESDIERLHDEYKSSKNGHHMAASTLLELLLIQLHRHKTTLDSKPLSTQTSGDHPRGLRQPPWLQKVLLYMQHHFRDPITLADTASHVSLSPTYFSQAFHKATGIPFQHYLQNLRLEFAYHLLRSSTLPVTDICYASGYQTLTHFVKVFRDKYGLSPRNMRNQP